MADVKLTYKGNTILELSASGNKTIKTAGKYCEDDISLAYVKSGGGSGSDILYNGDFSVNTTGVTSWSAENSGTSEQRAVKIIDGWFLMECNAEKTSGGLKVIPKKKYGYLLTQINRWFAGSTVTITAVVNGITYTQTGTMSSGASVGVATPWGNIYFYNYSNVSYYLTFQFINQINAEFSIENVSVDVV